MIVFEYVTMEYRVNGYNNFFLFIAFEGFYSIELRSVGIKTIRKFACEEFLAPNYVKREAQKTSKVFIYVFVLQSIPFSAQNYYKKSIYASAHVHFYYFFAFPDS